MDLINYQYLDVGENKIAYKRQGEGQTILFIHGIVTYSFIWRNIAPSFAARNDVITIDLLGCGFSDKAFHQDLSLKKQAQIIHTFCSKLKLQKIILVCHDVGGGIGQILAVNYPKYFSKLVLINSIGYNYWPVQPIISMRIPIIRQLIISVLDMGMLSLVIKRGLYYKNNLSNELLALFSLPLKNIDGRKSVLQFIKNLNTKDLIEIDEQISELTIPTLIIRGKADIYLSKAICNRLHTQIKTSKLITIKTGGHFIQEDEPELISSYIKSFI